MGFIGQYCQCRGFDAAITFHGYNQIMVDYLAQGTVTTSDHLIKGYRYVIFQLASVIAELLNIDKKSLLNITAIAVGPKADGDDSNVSTQIKYQIFYSCPDYNPTLTNSQLMQSFSSNLLPNFVPHPTIQKLFIFPNNDDETIGTIADVPENFPDPEITPPPQNSAVHLPTTNLFLLYLLLSSLLLCF
jgi:hypothetical protein